MTYEQYRYIFIGFTCAAVVMFAVSVVLFIVLKIPDIIGDLTGRTERRGVEEIRRRNVESGSKRHKPSAVNIARGKITEPITASGRLKRENRSRSNKLIGTWTAEIGNSTEGNETISLSAEETMLLHEQVGTETVLLQAAEETMVLHQAEEMVVAPEFDEYGYNDGAEFYIEFEITFVHTNEVIG